MDTSAIVMGALGLQSDDEHVAVAVLQHLDRRVVEAAQALGGDDFLRFSNRESAMRDVEDAVNDRQQWVDVMRDEEHGEAVELVASLAQANGFTVLLIAHDINPLL